jgi:cold shock CspA family protein
MFTDQGYGFIRNLEGREIYFHRNAVLGEEFDNLKIGAGVRWTEQEGDKGSQASSVRVVDQRGRARSHRKPQRLTASAEGDLMEPAQETDPEWMGGAPGRAEK